MPISALLLLPAIPVALFEGAGPGVKTTGWPLPRDPPDEPMFPAGNWEAELLRMGSSSGSIVASNKG